MRGTQDRSKFDRECFNVAILYQNKYKGKQQFWRQTYEQAVERSKNDRCFSVFAVGTICWLEFFICVWRSTGESNDVRQGKQLYNLTLAVCTTSKPFSRRIYKRARNLVLKRHYFCLFVICLSLKWQLIQLPSDKAFRFIQEINSCIQINIKFN